MGHEAGDDDRRSGRADDLCKVCAREGVGPRLLDDGFAWQRGQSIDDRAAMLGPVEHAAGSTAMGDMDDLRAGGPSRNQQFARLFDRRFRFGKPQGADEIFVLVVDQDQRRLIKRRRVSVTPASVKRVAGAAGERVAAVIVRLLAFSKRGC